MNHERFAAIDFETANPSRESACAVGIVLVEGGQITARERRLIRPPTQSFAFTGIHGIAWNQVANAPKFVDVWSDFEKLISGVKFLAAHNATFDRSVINTCCRSAGITPPVVPMRCSMLISRKVWGIYPTTLPNVCRRLGISLQHHDPLSDAEACAKIVLAADQACGGTLR